MRRRASRLTGGIARLALVTSLALALGCDGRRPREQKEGHARPGEDHLAVLDLTGGAPELAGGSLLGGSGSNSFADLVGTLRALRDEEHVKAIYVDLGTASLNLARAAEIGRLLGSMRDGRPVVCHADGLATGTALMTSLGCSEVWLTPAGSVDTYGIAAQLMFGRELLDRLEVKVDFIQVGRFKGASEPFTRNSASPEARESLQGALAGVRAAWLEGVTKGRGRAIDSEALEDGPHDAEAAAKLGIIDRVGFADEARARAEELAGGGARDYFGGREPGSGGLGVLLDLLASSEPTRLPHVAVVRATGAITLSGGGLLDAPGIVERRLHETLGELAEDPAVRAVVLRIDSPGGSALASDLLWRDLMKLREEKPLIVSVGGMAASGGYYMACAAQKVVVEPTSILGSIGVVAGKLSVAEPLAELGIHSEVVPARPGHDNRPLLGSPLTAWDEATRSKVLDGIQHAYDLFLGRIAEGRGLPRAAIEPHAEGRLMSGEAAVKAGLADELGGLDRALDLAIELSDLSAGAPIRIVERESGLLGLVGLSPGARQEALAELERETARRTARLVAAGLVPYREELWAFAATAQPLLGGEHVVAALPFALIIR